MQHDYYSDQAYDARDQARADAQAEADTDEPGYRYFCGGHTSRTGPCGASDCGSCRNGLPPWEEALDADEAATEFVAWVRSQWGPAMRTQWLVDTIAGDSDVWRVTVGDWLAERDETANLDEDEVIEAIEEVHDVDPATYKTT
jgi:hypothetical protein